LISPTSARRIAGKPVRREQGEAVATRAGADVADPIVTEVIRHGLEAAADQMRIALRRMAFSPVIYELTDFGAALYDREVRLLAQAQAFPLFLGTLSFCVESALERLGGCETLDDGDVIVTTYGYDTGSHPQDLVVIVPGFHDGELVGYAVVKAHQLDMAAKDVYCTDTTDIFQEGTIFPAVRLYRRGERNDDLYRTLLANSRLPALLEGDLAAQIAAANIGLNGLRRLLERHGRPAVDAAIERMLDHGEVVMRAFLAEIPDGRYEGRGALDSDGISQDSIEFGITVEVEGSDVTIDFCDAPPEQVGPVNCPRPTTVSAARLSLLCFAGRSGSVNDGHFRPIRVRTRPGTLFEPAPPKPIFMYYLPGVQAVDVIHRAIANALPDVVPAGSGGDLCATGFYGVDEDGNFWADGMDFGVGQGASARGDGAPALIHVAGSGQRTTPVEVFEARRPFLVEHYELAPGSGGDGRHRGGLGVDVTFRALSDCFLLLLWDRMKTAPWGMDGGEEGRINRVTVRYPDGSSRETMRVTGLPIPAGTCLDFHSGGGGGYGPPAERAAEARAHDAAEGLVLTAGG
jgi:N-methylhydantoinase B